MKLDKYPLASKGFVSLYERLFMPVQRQNRVRCDGRGCVAM